MYIKMSEDTLDYLMYDRDDVCVYPLYYCEEMNYFFDEDLRPVHDVNNYVSVDEEMLFKKSKEDVLVYNSRLQILIGLYYTSHLEHYCDTLEKISVTV